MKSWTRYFDNLGLVINGDTGDSCRETATYLCAQKKEHQPLVWNSLIKCQVDGLWVRHPKPASSEWHYDPKEFSRDQWTALMCAMLCVPAYCGPAFDEMLKKQIKHPFTAQNGDLITWEWVLYLRHLTPFSYPLIFFLDFGLIINVLIRIVKSYIYGNKDTADDINLVTMIYVFTKNHPTPFVYLARKLYKLRKLSVQSAWDSYYARQEAPPMNQLWEEIIKKYF